MPAPAGPPGGLVLSVRAGVGEVILGLSGRLGVRDVEGLESALMRVVACRPGRVVIDLSELRSAAALCVGSLNAFRHAITRAGGQVALLNPSPEVAGLLRGSRLDVASENYDPSVGSN